MRVFIYQGMCHNCDTRVIVSQPESALLKTVRGAQAGASSGRGLCPVCAKRITWARVATADRKGGAQWPP